jgi:predicted dehydrogenase
MNAVVIGCGNRGKDHCDAYARIPGVKLTGCFDPDAERREKLAKAFGMKAYSNVEEMLAKERPGIVSITTYPDVRLELMKLVSKYEVPLCLTEKPLATGVRDWREMCELEAASKTKFAVSHQVRWHKDLSRCGEVINSGRLGKVLFLDLSARMNISGQGTHTLNYGMLLNGDSPVKTVFGNAHGLDMNDPKHPAPVTSEAMLTFENGVRALWTSGNVSPCAGEPDVFWQHVRVAAYAEKGRVNYEEFGDWQIVEGAKTESGNYGGMDVWKANNCDSQTRLQSAMLEWLANPAKKPGTNLKQSLHEWAVVLALYQSSVEGRPIDMKGFNPPDNLIELYRSKVNA